MERVDIAIIGAGIVGLATAAALARSNENIIVLERNDSFGRETSSRNSEVIHSGLYYPEGSLKTRLCVTGAAQLFDLAGRHAIPHKRIGKLIVATEESERAALVSLYQQGQRNGISGLSLLDRDEVRKLEPNTRAVAAIHSPNTGIIDSHALMAHYYREATARSVLFSFQSEVSFIERQHDGFVLGIVGDDYRFHSRVVVNSAGLASDRVAELAGLDVDACGYRIHYCKGSYFSYSKPSPLRMLVYPVPHEHLTGLGVHATLDLGGRLRFGPDAEYVDTLDYKVDPKKQDEFYQGAIKIVPGLDRQALQADMAGVRPKLSGKDEAARDFVIADEASRGLPGLINLIGIESPGLTAASAIAAMASDLAAPYLK